MYKYTLEILEYYSLSLSLFSVSLQSTTIDHQAVASTTSITITSCSGGVAAVENDDEDRRLVLLYGYTQNSNKTNGWMEEEGEKGK